MPIVSHTLAYPKIISKKHFFTGLPGFGYYDGYGRVLPYAGGLGYVGHPAYPGLGYRAFPGVGYPGYLGHPGYLAGHPYYGHPYAAYPYVR